MWAANPRLISTWEAQNERRHGAVTSDDGASLTDTTSHHFSPLRGSGPFVGCGIALIVLTWFNTASRTPQPLVYADEAGYFLHARSFAGLGDFPTTGYHPGFSLLISPVFSIFESMEAVFRSIQVINLGLLLVAFWLLLLVVRHVVPDAAPWVAPGAATAAIIYPTWSAFGALVLPECLLLVLATATYLLALRGFEEPHRWMLPAGAFLAGLVPSVHPRALVIPLAWGAVTLLGVALKRLSLATAARVALAGLVGGAIAFTIVSVGTSPAEGNSAGGLLSRLLTAEGATSYPSVVLGHWFYAAAATLGLTPLGFVVLSRRAPSSLGSALVIATSIFALMLSAAFMLVGLTDKAIYGRYAEPFLMVFAAVGLATVVTTRRWWHLAVMVGSIGISAGIVRLTREGAIFAGSYNRSNVFTLVPLIDQLGAIRLGWIAAVTIALAIGVWFGTSQRVRSIPGLALLAVVFLTVSWMNSIDYFERTGRIRSDSGQLASMIQSTHQEVFDERLPCVTIDRREIAQWYRYNYLVLLHRAEANQVLGPAPESAECSPWVLSTTTDVDDLVPGARLVSLEAHAQVGLWVLPGPAQDHLAEHDALYPPGWEGPIPESARSARVELLNISVGDSELEVELRVHHTGTGSPWPGSSGLLRGVSGPVRVGAAVVTASDDDPVDPANRVDIPASVPPGSSFDVAVTVPFDPVTLEQGATPQLAVGLIQEGVAWFEGTYRFDLLDLATP